jgi:hypothetical protein
VYLKAGIEYLTRSFTISEGTGLSSGQVAFRRMPSNGDDFMTCEGRYINTQNIISNIQQTLALRNKSLYTDCPDFVIWSSFSRKPGEFLLFFDDLDLVPQEKRPPNPFLPAFFKDPLDRWRLLLTSSSSSLSNSSSSSSAATFLFLLEDGRGLAFDDFLLVPPLSSAMQQK